MIDALAARAGGGRRVGHELARALARRDDVARVWILTPAGTEGPPAEPQLETVPIQLGERLQPARRALWEARRLGKFASEVGADGVVALAGMLPRRLACPTVAMPANTLVFESRSVGNRVRRFAVVRTAKWAHAVLVASSRMADLIEPHVPVKVVPHGIDHDMFRPAEKPGSELVFVADYYGHKRHDLALAAWERLPTPRPVLRLVGDVTTDPDLARRVAGRGAAVSGGTVLMETASEHEMPAVLQRARVALMPSEEESFSLPMIEAAACGVPVVARDLPVLRETGGPGAVFVSGDEPAEWASAIQRLMTDDEAHGQARVRSLAHARAFSWDKKAAAVVAALRERAD